MKTKHQILALATSIALAGCNPSEQGGGEPQTGKSDSANPPLEPKPEAQAAPVRPPAAPAPGAKESATINKDQFVAAADLKLKSLEAKLADLVTKAGSLTGDAKTQANQALAALREEVSNAREKLEALKNAGAGAWTEAKAGFESVMTDLDKAYENAKAKCG